MTMSTTNLTPTNSLAIFTTRWHALAFISAFVICIMCIVWEWLGAPVREGGTLLVLKCLPLALCLHGLWRGKLYVFQIVSMLILLYMSEGVIRGLGDTGAGRFYAWGEFILSWVCFFGCLFYVSPYKKAHKQAKAKLKV
jgi:uncharacterized membrane protein